MYQPTENELARARARAYADGIHIVKRATTDDGAQVIWTTSSRSGAEWYSVVVTATALMCSCPAGVHGRAYCKHRVVVRDSLVAERAEAQRKAQAKAKKPATAPAPVVAPVVATVDRDSAILAPRGNAGFSMWK